MGKQRRYHARYSQSKTDEYLRRHSEKQGDSVAVSEPGVVKMQHAIGNQAVQRLLQRDIQHDKGVVVQRAPGGERPGALATIVLSNKGKLRGGSRIAGHEGKIEMLSLSFGGTGAQKPSSRESESEEQRVTFSLLKYVDDSSAALMEALLKGEGVKFAQFELIRTDDEGKVEVFHTIEHSDGMIASFQTAGSDNSGKPLESLTIEFVVKPKK